MSFYCCVSGLTSLWGVGSPPPPLPGSKNRIARLQHVGLISCSTSARAHYTNDRFVSGLYHFLRPWRSTFISSFFHSSPRSHGWPSRVWCQGLAALSRPMGLWSSHPAPRPPHLGSEPALSTPQRRWVPSSGWAVAATGPQKPLDADRTSLEHTEQGVGGAGTRHQQGISSYRNAASGTAGHFSPRINVFFPIYFTFTF